LTGKTLYKSSVGRDLKHIGSKDKGRLLSQIREILAENPRSGDSLHGEFAGLFKMRIGDYRIIYAMLGEDVVILRIRHRSKVYG
jgi:mRNA interferase RelE/StbE